MIDPTAKIHPLACVDPSAEVGAETVIWQFASVLAGVKIGRQCSVGAGAEIGRGSVIGNHTRISSQVFLPSNSILEERVFIGPGARFADDLHPRAGNTSYKAQPPHVESGASVGMSAVILPGLTLGAGCMIAAGAIVTKNVAPHEHVRGEPARVKSYSRVHAEESWDIYAEPIRERVKAGEKVRIA